MLAFLFLILLFYGLDKITKIPHPAPPLIGRGRRRALPAISLPYKGRDKGWGFGVGRLSLAITASYTLGPDTNAVGKNQYNAQVMFGRKSNLRHQPFVLSDTHSLLALEAVSEKQIIGYGFPISANLASRKRSAL